jgi:fluoride ion exporter CrcB/FEX
LTDVTVRSALLVGFSGEASHNLETHFIFHSSKEVKKEQKLTFFLECLGCLTTVSTFVDEIYGLKLVHSWIYGIVSVFSVQILLFVINAAYFWS